MDISNVSEIIDARSTQDIHIHCFMYCFTSWMKIQKQKLHLLALQRKLHHSLLLYMKRRQHRLREVADFSNPNMRKLLEYIKSPLQFYKVFRVSLPAFKKFRSVLYENPFEISGRLPELELLVFLFWLSASASCRKVSKLLSLPISTINDIVDNTLENFFKKMSKVIKFPKESVHKLGKKYQILTSSHIFGLVVGCLDTYHVEIYPSSKIDRAQFLNSDNYLSIQIQVVCDSEGSFMAIAVGFPGNMTKSQILQCTPLYINTPIPPGYILLGGSGYPCLQEPVCLISPFLDNKGLTEQEFNNCVNKAHLVIEKSVGQIFSRWRRIFFKPITLPLAKLTYLMIACSMMQNMCLEVEDEWPEVTAVNFSLNKVQGDTLCDQLNALSMREQMAQLLLSDNEDT